MTEQQLLEYVETLQDQIANLKHDLYEAKESNIGLRGVVQSFITTNTALVEENEFLKSQMGNIYVD